MKCVEVALYEFTQEEAKMLSDGVPVLIFDTMKTKNQYKIVKSSGLAPWHDPFFDNDRYVLFLFDLPIGKVKNPCKLLEKI